MGNGVLMHLQGVHAAVDVFFSRSLSGCARVMEMLPAVARARGSLNCEAHNALMEAEVAARGFINGVRLLPASEGIKNRLDQCERRFDAAWGKAVTATDALVASSNL